MTEQAPQVEQVKQPEILDLENHISFYGRLFMASQAKTAKEVADIINPAAEVTFQLDADRVSLDKRDYNPVFQNLSFKERKDAWQEPYAEAKSKWLSQFTNFMHTIEKGSNRELALKAILPNIQNAEEFTEAHAETLFKEFCDGDESNVHKFTSKLVSKLTNKDLLSDLKWIASGLFGSQTAGMVTNLLYLESAIYNKQVDIVDILNRNNEKIKNPQDNELCVLGYLYNLIPQEERGSAQVVVPATPSITSITSVPSSTAVSEPAPKPAPFTPVTPVTPDEEKVEGELPVAPVEKTKSDKDKDKRPPSPPPPTVPESASEKSLQDMNLEELKIVNDSLNVILNNLSIGERDRIENLLRDSRSKQLAEMSDEDIKSFYNDPTAELRMSIELLKKILEKEGLISPQPQPVEKPVETVSAVSGVGFSEDPNSKYRSSMEDAHTIIERGFAGKPDQGFFAIYDGHGGKEVAEKAAKELHEILAKHLKNHQPDEALKLSYREFNENVLSSNLSAGSTAVTALILRNKLFVANIGDSRVVLARNGQAERLSYDHKGLDDEEIKLVEGRGGKIDGYTGRVLLNNGSNLDMTRAFGDPDFKDYITAEPNIKEVLLNQGDKFLILACDGLWDVVSDQEAVGLIKDIEDSRQASNILKDKAIEKGSTDNVSVMVVKLKPIPPEKNVSAEGAGEAKPGSFPGQTEFDLNIPFTGTDDNFLNGLTSLQQKYPKLGV